MSDYQVKIPIDVTVNVDAESDEDATRKALDIIRNEIDFGEIEWVQRGVIDCFELPPDEQDQL